MKVTAQQVYKMLKDDLDALSGRITFGMAGANITIHRRDIVGNVLQEWLEGWLTTKGIDFDQNPNTQMPPDIFLDPDNHKQGLVEVKSFNYKLKPGFDISDFKSFGRYLIENPYALYADYLIFGYEMNDITGEITIKEVWLKKVWEIVGVSKNWPITLQYKNGRVHKIRPCTWYGLSPRSFKSKEDFLSAIEETMYQNDETKPQFSLWKVKFNRSHKKFYGEELDIPRWDDIKHKYGK